MKKVVFSNRHHITDPGTITVMLTVGEQLPRNSFVFVLHMVEFMTTATVTCIQDCKMLVLKSKR